MDSVTCRVMKNDTASLARVLIHVIDTGKCHADQLEIGASFDHRPGNRPIAQQEDVSVAYLLDQLGIAQASCVADGEAMTALFQEISEPRPDRCFGLADGFNDFNIHNWLGSARCYTHRNGSSQ